MTSCRTRRGAGECSSRPGAIVRRLPSAFISAFISAPARGVIPQPACRAELHGPSESPHGPSLPPWRSLCPARCPVGRLPRGQPCRTNLRMPSVLVAVCPIAHHRRNQQNGCACGRRARAQPPQAKATPAPASLRPPSPSPPLPPPLALLPWCSVAAHHAAPSSATAPSASVRVDGARRRPRDASRRRPDSAARANSVR